MNQTMNRTGGRWLCGIAIVALVATGTVAGRVVASPGAGAQQAAAVRTDQAELQLQAARNKQVVEGKLDEAIKLYRDVVARYGQNRVVVARALVGLGQCYEKLGTAQAAEARKAYQQIVSQYADQADAATQARARLAAMGSEVATTTGGSANGPVVRTLWRGREANAQAAISRDGRFLAYDDGGKLVVREIATGRLTDLGDFTYGFEPLLWSPDGRQLAYVDWSKADNEIKLVRVDGTSKHSLYTDSPGRRLDWAFDWSRDGRFLAVGLRPNRIEKGNQLLLVDSVNGSAKTLGVLSKLENVRISPDGGYLACSVRPAIGAPVSVQVWTTDGRGVVGTLEAPGGVELIDWTPDGKGLVYASRHEGETSIMLQPVTQGAASGPSTLLRRNVGEGFDVLAGRVTANGSIVVGISGSRTDVYVTAVAFDSGRVLEPPRKLTPWVGAQLHCPSWAPDGRLAFLIPKFGSRTHAGAIGLHNLQLGQTVQLPLALGATLTQNPPRWTARTDEAFLDAGGEGPSATGLYRVDLPTGRMSVVIPRGVDGGAPYLTAPARDGGTVYFVRWTTDYLSFPIERRPMSIWARDVATGQEREVYREPEPELIFSPVVLSADGQTLAFRYTTLGTVERGTAVVKVLDLRTSQVRELYRQPKAYISGIAVSVDGTRVAFTVRQSGAPQNLWSASVADGKATQTGLSVDGNVTNLSIHPDGKRIAYQLSTTGESEVLALDHLIPSSKAPAAPVPAKK